MGTRDIIILDIYSFRLLSVTLQQGGVYNVIYIFLHIWIHVYKIRSWILKLKWFKHNPFEFRFLYIGIHHRNTTRTKSRSMRKGGFLPKTSLFFPPWEIFKAAVGEKIVESIFSWWLEHLKRRRKSTSRPARPKNEVSFVRNNHDLCVSKHYVHVRVCRAARTGGGVCAVGTARNRPRSRVRTWRIRAVATL